MKSLQDHYAPQGQCFGCGSANSKGLRIKSYEREDASGEVVADWTAQPYHQAFPGVLNGGIIGALLDCHSNWTAIAALIHQQGLLSAPSMVTAEFYVKLKRPTPLDSPLHLRAKAIAIEGDKVTVEASLEANGKVTATCAGVFVAVHEGHPAFNRW